MDYRLSSFMPKLTMSFPTAPEPEPEPEPEPTASLLPISPTTTITKESTATTFTEPSTSTTVSPTLLDTVKTAITPQPVLMPEPEPVLAPPPAPAPELVEPSTTTAVQPKPQISADAVTTLVAPDPAPDPEPSTSTTVSPTLLDTIKAAITPQPAPVDILPSPTTCAPPTFYKPSTGKCYLPSPTTEEPMLSLTKIGLPETQLVTSPMQEAVEKPDVVICPEGYYKDPMLGTCKPASFTPDMGTQTSTPPPPPVDSTPPPPPVDSPMQLPSVEETLAAMKARCLKKIGWIWDEAKKACVFDACPAGYREGSGPRCFAVAPDMTDDCNRYDKLSPEYFNCVTQKSVQQGQQAVQQAHSAATDEQKATACNARTGYQWINGSCVQMEQQQTPQATTTSSDAVTTKTPQTQQQSSQPSPDDITSYEDPSQVALREAAKPDNTMKYALLGVAGVALIGAIAYGAKGKKSKKVKANRRRRRY